MQNWTQFKIATVFSFSIFVMAILDYIRFYTFSRFPLFSFFLQTVSKIIWICALKPFQPLLEQMQWFWGHKHKPDVRVCTSMYEYIRLCTSIYVRVCVCTICTYTVASAPPVTDSVLMRKFRLLLILFLFHPAFTLVLYLLLFPLPFISSQYYSYKLYGTVLYIWRWFTKQILKHYCKLVLDLSLT